MGGWKKSYKYTTYPSFLLLSLPVSSPIWAPKTEMYLPPFIQCMNDDESKESFCSNAIPFSLWCRYLTFIKFSRIWRRWRAFLSLLLFFFLDRSIFQSFCTSLSVYSYFECSTKLFFIFFRKHVLLVEIF